MKPLHRQTVKISAIVVSMVVFSLIILPLCMVKLFAVPGMKIEIPALRPNVVISVYRHETGQVIKVNLEDYVMGVVAGEMPSSFEMEALKAQAVAARTYGMSKVMRAGRDGNSADHPGAPLCDDTHCQVYRSVEELETLKSAEWMETGWLRIQQATEETAGQLMYYQGEMVEQPLFHASSGGKTENSEDVFVSAVPYLRSVDSPYESEAPYQQEQVQMKVSEFAQKISNAYPGKSAGTVNKDTIKILERSEGGRVDALQVGNLSVEGRKIRDIFGLRSANFTLSFVGDNIIVTTSGYGHGVGMSQWGANGMAQSGFDYKEILQHYYSGVNVW